MLVLACATPATNVMTGYAGAPGRNSRGITRLRRSRLAIIDLYWLVNAPNNETYQAGGSNQIEGAMTRPVSRENLNRGIRRFGIASDGTSVIRVAPIAT